jgi:two-component system response regulator FixJ
MPESVRIVYVIDDDDAVRDSLQILIAGAGYEVHAYCSATQFLETVAQLPFGCVITDVRMPEMTGLELQTRLKTSRPDLPLILITGHADVHMAVAAMKAGAHDFLEKPLNVPILLESVKESFKSFRKTKSASGSLKLASLTPRERTVVDLLVEGLSNKVIAFRLGIDTRTIETHRFKIMHKIGVKSLAALVRLVLTEKSES